MFAGFNVGNLFKEAYALVVLSYRVYRRQQPPIVRPQSGYLGV